MFANFVFVQKCQTWTLPKNHTCNEIGKNTLPYEVKSNEILGRHLIATRDINEGEIILKQNPLVLGPKTVSYPLCLGCHKTLNFEKNGRFDCSKCFWPLCDKFCETSALHEQECDVLAKTNYKPTINENNTKQSVYSLITPLRALLLKINNPEKFDNVLNCQSHLVEHLTTPVYQILKHNLVPFFCDLLKLDTNETEILTICSIFDTNCFDVRDDKGLINVRGLYSNISLLSHDCKHNTRHFFQEDFTVVLISSVPIAKGDLITTTYTQTFWGTLARRSHLKQSKLFNCECQRCRDPTEFGTYVGSVCCNQCSQGSKLICCDPLNAQSDWECDNCGFVVQGEEYSWGNQVLKEEISRLDKSNLTSLEDFLEKYDQLLHKSNSYVLQVKHALIQMYGYLDGYGYTGKYLLKYKANVAVRIYIRWKV